MLQPISVSLICTSSSSTSSTRNDVDDDDDVEEEEEEALYHALLCGLASLGVWVLLCYLKGPHEYK